MGRSRWEMKWPKSHHSESTLSWDLGKRDGRRSGREGVSLPLTDTSARPRMRKRIGPPALKECRRKGIVAIIHLAPEKKKNSSSNGSAICRKTDCKKKKRPISSYFSIQVGIFRSKAATSSTASISSAVSSEKSTWEKERRKGVALGPFCCQKEGQRTGLISFPRFGQCGKKGAERASGHARACQEVRC